jgi:hypothetical protein
MIPICSLLMHSCSFSVVSIGLRLFVVYCYLSQASILVVPCGYIQQQEKVLLAMMHEAV